MALKSSVKSEGVRGGCVQRSLPNLITFLRLCAVPVTLLFIIQDQFFSAFSIFFIAAVTDWADGFLARRWNVVSSFGQLFDPLADKALIVLVTLLLGWKAYLPPWLVGIIVCRDLMLISVGLYIFYYKLNFSLRPSFISKLNTFVQLILLGGVLFFNVSLSSLSKGGFFSPLSLFSVVMLWGTALTTVLSGLGYLRLLLKKIRENKI